jgi:hypothetical protein
LFVSGHGFAFGFRLLAIFTVEYMGFVWACASILDNELLALGKSCHKQQPFIQVAVYVEKEGYLLLWATIEAKAQNSF